MSELLEEDVTRATECIVRMVGNRELGRGDSQGDDSKCGSVGHGGQLMHGGLRR